MEFIRMMSIASRPLALRRSPGPNIRRGLLSLRTTAGEQSPAWNPVPASAQDCVCWRFYRVMSLSVMTGGRTSGTPTRSCTPGASDSQYSLRTSGLNCLFP